MRVSNLKYVTALMGDFCSCLLSKKRKQAGSKYEDLKIVGVKHWKRRRRTI